jgi:hypothetical protein
MRAGRQARGCQPRRPLLPAADPHHRRPHTHCIASTSEAVPRSGQLFESEETHMVLKPDPDWQMALPSKAMNRDRSPGRTSRPALPANDPLPTRSMCSGKRCHRPCRSLHERKPDSQTKDDIGTEVRDRRSCGRSQASLYNERRPHTGRAPAEVGATSGKGGLDSLPVPPSIPSLHDRWSPKMAADSPYS